MIPPSFLSVYIYIYIYIYVCMCLFVCVYVFPWVRGCVRLDLLFCKREEFHRIILIQVVDTLGVGVGSGV